MSRGRKINGGENAALLDYVKGALETERVKGVFGGGEAEDAVGTS